MNDPLGDALRKAGSPRLSDDPAVLDAAERLAHSSQPLARAAQRRRGFVPGRPIARFAIGLTIVGAVLVVGAAVSSPLVSPSVVPAAGAGACVLETYVEASDKNNSGDVAQAAAAEQFVVASDRQALVLEAEAGADRNGVDAQDSSPELLAAEVRIKSEEVSDAVAAAGYPSEAILLDFAVRCREDPAQ